MDVRKYSIHPFHLFFKSFLLGIRFGSFRPSLTVRINDVFFHPSARVRIDGMYDIRKSPVAPFFGRHDDKKLSVRRNELDIVYRDGVVQRHRQNRLQRLGIKDPSEFNVCNIHIVPAFLTLSLLCAERCGSIRRIRLPRLFLCLKFLCLTFTTSILSASAASACHRLL